VFFNNPEQLGTATRFRAPILKLHSGNQASAVTGRELRRAEDLRA
jgi:hypothetical protein